MEAYKVECPSCGASVNLEKNVIRCFCPYCGTQFLIDDGIIRSEITKNETVIYRDEARLKELQLAEEARLRKEAEKEAWKQAKKKAWKRVLIIAGIYFIICVILSFFQNNRILSILASFLTIGAVVIPFFFPYKYYQYSRFGNYLVYFLCFFMLFIAAGLIVASIESLFPTTSVESTEVEQSVAVVTPVPSPEARSTVFIEPEWYNKPSFQIPSSGNNTETIDDSFGIASFEIPKAWESGERGDDSDSIVFLIKEDQDTIGAVCVQCLRFPDEINIDEIEGDGLNKALDSGVRNVPFQSIQDISPIEIDGKKGSYAIGIYENRETHMFFVPVYQYGFCVEFFYDSEEAENSLPDVYDFINSIKWHYSE